MFNYNEYLLLEGTDFTKEAAAILFTDMVESSKMWSKNEKKMMEIIIEQEKRIQKIVDANKGMIVKGIGDSFMIKFDDLIPAIQTAIDIQKDLTENPLEINERLLKLRIGICYGKVWVKENIIQGKKLLDYYGNTINSSSRIESKVSEVDGFAFASLIKLDKEDEIKKLIKDFDVKEIDFKDKDGKEYKRSGRLLTDVHHYVAKSLDELKGIRPVTVYSCLKK